MAFAPVVAVLVVGRFIVGIGVGLVSMAVPIYLSESSPERFRGAIVSVNVLFITGGQFISYAVDLAFYDVPDFQWRCVLYVVVCVSFAQHEQVDAGRERFPCHCAVCWNVVLG